MIFTKTAQPTLSSSALAHTFSPKSENSVSKTAVSPIFTNFSDSLADFVPISIRNSSLFFTASFSSPFKR